MDQQLQAFAMVVEEKNFTRAAEKLHISQPAISQHIRNLERRLNVTLLDRTNKYVRLNKAGDLVYHHAKAILNLYNNMDRLVDDLQNHAGGPLKIGSSYTFGEYVLPHVIAKFRSQYPEITPSITIGNTRSVVDSVAHGELDIGIIEGTATAADVVVESFADDTVVVVASARHRLNNHSNWEVRELDQETWIVREVGSGTREITDYVFAKYGILPKSMMEFGSTQIIKESVEAGLGITLLSKWVIRKELQWGTLVELGLGDVPVQRKFSMVYLLSDFHTKATALFREFLRERPFSIASFTN